MTETPALPPTLEEIELEQILAHYEHHTVPPDVPQDDFGRMVLRAAFVSGFGSALAIASRLERESPERRAEILKRLEGQMWVAARKHGESGASS